MGLRDWTKGGTACWNFFWTFEGITRTFCPVNRGRGNLNLKILLMKKPLESMHLYLTRVTQRCDVCDILSPSYKSPVSHNTEHCVVWHYSTDVTSGRETSKGKHTCKLNVHCLKQSFFLYDIFTEMLKKSVNTSLFNYFCSVALKSNCFFCPGD